MTIVIIGGTGRIGSRLVGKLRARGHDAVPASPATEVNTITGEGLSEALAGADVVVDVSNPPSFEESAALRFFETSTRHLLAAGAAAGVAHHVVLSVVGNERMPDSAYQRAKGAQERLIRESAIPYSIVRATQFFEFLDSITDAATTDNVVRLPPVLFQPIAADDVAEAVVRISVGPPLNGVVEVGGPEPFRLDELVRAVLTVKGDPRNVMTDPTARYFGALLGERTLLPGEYAERGDTTLDGWLAGPSARALR